MKYRDRNEIIAQILESANGHRVTLTKIMYDGYLSHAVTKEYLMLLNRKGSGRISGWRKNIQDHREGHEFPAYSLVECKNLARLLRSCREGRRWFHFFKLKTGRLQTPRWRA